MSVNWKGESTSGRDESYLNRRLGNPEGAWGMKTGPMW